MIPRLSNRCSKAEQKMISYNLLNIVCTSSRKLWRYAWNHSYFILTIWTMSFLKKSTQWRQSFQWTCTRYHWATSSSSRSTIGLWSTICVNHTFLCRKWRRWINSSTREYHLIRHRLKPDILFQEAYLKTFKFHTKTLFINLETTITNSW